MRSCIVLFYISMTAASAEASPSLAASAQASQAQRAEAEVARAAEQVDPDTLYIDRANLGSARRASEIWAADLKSSTPSFDGAWKLARVNYWLGGHAPEPERRTFLEQGIEAARKAIALQPDRAEGHFWLAANMGTMAESFGLRAGLKYRGPVKEELETVLKLDPSFMNGSADRVLGRWYYRVPRLFGGSDTKAEQHLRQSLQYDENSTVSRFFLAELLIDRGRKGEARSELQKIIDAPINPEWAPEDKEYKDKARSLLGKIKD
jgi:tetratricopeptide (TPR) repeat protein